MMEKTMKKKKLSKRKKMKYERDKDNKKKIL